MFAIGSMPYSMCNTVVGFYLSIFLLEVAIVSGGTVFLNYKTLYVLLHSL